jgi:hypothetical protein
MNNVPAKLRKQWKLEDDSGHIRVCMRSEEGNCQGRLTKEHAIIYAGKQLQEDWAILDICAFHHGVDKFQDCGNLDKEKHIWIALNRAPEARLRELSKGEDKIALRDRLNAKYGIYGQKYEIKL